ncbi:hypothetical protein SLS62_009860 [Diatrype stigma]|uniref:Uncharacterized protein n=1 Tax=Diatrype stigma TaxID=117547 RepID=A0AAN9UE10_9PEZI
MSERSEMKLKVKNQDIMSHLPEPSDVLVIIIGAGISGLLAAQSLRKLGVPFRIFERDADFSGGGGSRGLGWGLTLHWSLPALRALLPEEIVGRLPEAYVDRAATVERGLVSAFPFYDLSTGELKASTPAAPESERIRVNRDRLRRLLGTDIDIQVKGHAIRSPLLPPPPPPPPPHSSADNGQRLSGNPTLSLAPLDISVPK